MARLGGRPGPSLSTEIELDSPYGVLKTTYGDVKNGTRGTVVSGVGEQPLRVQFDDPLVLANVPAHWAKIILR